MKSSENMAGRITVPPAGDRRLFTRPICGRRITQDVTNRYCVKVKELRPYWRYRHNSVEHPRCWNIWRGMVFLIIAADDPWWQTHMPQNGWGCKCEVESLSRYEAREAWEASGKNGPDTAPGIEWEDRVVGSRGSNPRVVRVPKGIDPWGSPIIRDGHGWNRIPFRH